MLRIAALIFIILISSSAFAEQWTFSDKTSTPGSKWIATVSNTNGETLNVWRKIARAGYEAYAEFNLSGNAKFSDKLPKYQIDNGKLEDANVIKRAGDNLGRRWAFIESGQAVWRIWQSTDTQLTSQDALNPWITGNQITIKYIDSKQQKKTAKFSLAGSGTAINMAIAGPIQ